VRESQREKEREKREERRTVKEQVGLQAHRVDPGDDQFNRLV
jgi:hypothetical protein